MARFKQIVYLAVFFAVMIGSQANAVGQNNGIHRLLNRAEVLEAKELNSDRDNEKVGPIEDAFVHPASALVPSDHFAKVAARKLASRQGAVLEGTIEPLPLSPEAAIKRNDGDKPLDRKVFQAANFRFHRQSTPEEYVFDGDDRGLKIQVDPDFNVYGLDPEDTFGHYDTLDGKRIVVPSNRVAIYAPRFGSVRKIDGVVNAQFNQPTIGFFERKQTVQATDTLSLIHI